jgi:hypothetical protein
MRQTTLAPVTERQGRRASASGVVPASRAAALFGPRFDLTPSHHWENCTNNRVIGRFARGQPWGPAVTAASSASTRSEVPST